MSTPTTKVRSSGWRKWMRPNLLIGGEGHLSLAGTALATDVDRDRLVQTLANGVWEGAWGEGTAAGRVTGSFNGRRINPPR